MHYRYKITLEDGSRLEGVIQRETFQEAKDKLQEVLDNQLLKGKATLYSRLPWSVNWLISARKSRQLIIL